MIRTSNVSVRETLRKLLPTSAIELVAWETGAFKRIRRISPVAFVWSLVLASVPVGGAPWPACGGSSTSSPGRASRSEVSTTGLPRLW